MEAAVCANLDVTKFLVLGKSKAEVKWKCAEYSVKMLEEGAHADITFEVTNGGSLKGSVKAHRSVLSSVSPVFAAMFQHDMKGKLTSIVRILDMTIDALKLLLLLLYTTQDNKDIGIPKLSDAVDKHFKEIHNAIKKYQLQNILGSLYFTALERNLNSENCWTYLQSHGTTSTGFSTCYEYIIAHFEEVINNESFYDAMKHIPRVVVCVMNRACHEASQDRTLKRITSLGVSSCKMFLIHFWFTDGLNVNPSDEVLYHTQNLLLFLVQIFSFTHD